MAQTAVELAKAVRTGELDPVPVTKAAVAGIAAADGVVGAFRRVRGDEALAEALALKERSDLAELPLAGVPIAVKDVTAVAGEDAEGGATAGAQQPFDADGAIGTRLRAAGAG